MDNNNNSIVKDDINFLEYPNWITNEREGVRELTIEKQKGLYTITTSLTLPNRFDKIILYYLLSELFNNTQFESTRIKTTRYKIAKNTFFSTSHIGKSEYTRIMNSLDRWNAVHIKFEGIFHKGDTYTNRAFHIIDGYKLHNDGQLEIYLNEQYLEHLRNTKYFKLIDFDEYKKLKRPSSNRLYEILIKTFKDREIWQIHIIKLGEKLTLSEKYPSQIHRIVLSAVNEIVRNTNLQVKLEYDENTHICTFIKLQDIQQDEKEESNHLNIPEDNHLKALIAILPKEHQDKKTILEAISNAFRKHGSDYVKRNIEYSNKHCRNNYRAYLNKALKEDWGLAFKEDEDVKQKKREEVQKEIEEQVRRRKEKELALQKQQQVIDIISKYMKDLSLEEQEVLLQEAIIRAEPETQKMSDQLYIQLAIRQKMQEIAAERLQLEL
jgi:hypothetical protein